MTNRPQREFIAPPLEVSPPIPARPHRLPSRIGWRPHFLPLHLARLSLLLSTGLLRSVALRELCALGIRLLHARRVHARRQGRTRALSSVREFCERSLGPEGVEKFVWVGFHVSERWRMLLHLTRPTAV